MRAFCRRCDAAVDAEGAWPGRCAACATPVEEDPLQDVVVPGLRVLFVGINPGIMTARCGLHFANPRNAFWGALHESGLVAEPLGPGDQAHLLESGMGITNVVTRATAGSNDVTGEDVARGRARLARVVQELRPRWLAFVGKEAYRMATGERAAAFGEQPRLWGARVFVLPSTSPANAGIPRAEKVAWFARLREAAWAGEARGGGASGARA